MNCLLVLSPLLATVSSLLTLSYTFNNTAQSRYLAPTYPLGFIPPNTTVYFTIKTLTSNLDLSNAYVQLLVSYDYTVARTFGCSG